MHNRQFSQHFGRLFVGLIDLASSKDSFPSLQRRTSSPLSLSPFCPLTFHLYGLLVMRLGRLFRCARVCVNILQNFPEFFASFSPPPTLTSFEYATQTHTFTGVPACLEECCDFLPHTLHKFCFLTYFPWLLPLPSVSADIFG